MEQLKLEPYEGTMASALGREPWATNSEALLALASCKCLPSISDCRVVSVDAQLAVLKSCC